MTAAILQIGKTHLNSYRKVAYREIRKEKCSSVRNNYPRKQRPLLALNAMPFLQPTASACCTILRTSTATTVTSPNAATVAKIVSIVSVSIISYRIKYNIYKYALIIF